MPHHRKSHHHGKGHPSAPIAIAARQDSGQDLGSPPSARHHHSSHKASTSLPAHPHHHSVTSPIPTVDGGGGGRRKSVHFDLAHNMERTLPRDSGKAWKKLESQISELGLTTPATRAFADYYVCERRGEPTVVVRSPPARVAATELTAVLHCGASWSHDGGCGSGLVPPALSPIVFGNRGRSSGSYSFPSVSAASWASCSSTSTAASVSLASPISSSLSNLIAASPHGLALAHHFGWMDPSKLGPVSEEELVALGDDDHSDDHSHDHTDDDDDDDEDLDAGIDAMSLTPSIDSTSDSGVFSLDDDCEDGDDGIPGVDPDQLTPVVVDGVIRTIAMTRTPDHPILHAPTDGDMFVDLSVLHDMVAFTEQLRGDEEDVDVGRHRRKSPDDPMYIPKLAPLCAPSVAAVDPPQASSQSKSSGSPAKHDAPTLAVMAPTATMHSGGGKKAGGKHGKHHHRHSKAHKAAHAQVAV
ncbi:hypothetical protein BC828DRAFT_377934, partial [Blastocladiella britannica]